MEDKEKVKEEQCLFGPRPLHPTWPPLHFSAGDKNYFDFLVMLQYLKCPLGEKSHIARPVLTIHQWLRHTAKCQRWQRLEAVARYWLAVKEPDWLSVIDRSSLIFPVPPAAAGTAQCFPQQLSASTTTGLCQFLSTFHLPTLPQRHEASVAHCLLPKAQSEDHH